jgi:hypothetical protein
MSHPHGKFIGAEHFGQSKILFLQSPGRSGVLVTSFPKRRQKTMRFKSSHAAIDWCDSQGVMLLYFPAVNPSKN